MNTIKGNAVDNKIDEGTKDALDTIGASLYGLSPEFVRNEGKLIDNIRKTLSQKIESQNGEKSNGVGGDQSNVGEYVTIMTKLNTFREKRDLIDSIKNGAYYTNPSGSYEITDENRNNTSSDNQLMNIAAVEDIAGLYHAHFSLMPEYAKACQLIPELDKAVNTIVRDIINADEVTYRFLNNFYTDNDKDRQDEIEEKIKDLLDEYDLENKLRKWIKDAEVMGAKPVTVLPLDDVIVGLNRSIKDGVIHDSSTEDEDIYVTESDMLKPNPIPVSTIKQYKKIQDIKNGTTTSTEDMEFAKSSRGKIERTVENFTRDIITPDLVDEYCRLCNEEWLDEIKYEKKKLAGDRNKYDTFVKSVEEFEKKLNSVDIDEKYSSISKEMQDMVFFINSFIEVVDEKKAAKYQSLKYLRKKKFSSENDDEEGYDDSVIRDFYGVKGRDVNFKSPTDTSRKVVDGEIVDAKIQGVQVDMTEKPVNLQEFKKAFKNKRAILTEYDPEYVIPVTNDAGEHIGYFIMEYVRMNDENFSIIKKNRGSFLDILRRLGITEDKALVSGSSTMISDTMGPYNSGVYSPMTILSPMSVSNVNGPLTPFGSGFNSRRLKQKNDLIKTIFVKTITKRLKKNLCEDLEKNGTFQSSLFNIIRDEMLFKNNVRFTFIPEDHVVYFSRDLDSQGFPLSVLDGTLFYIYLYITSTMSSIMAKVMKSSNSEVMEINVGIAKNINATIEQIQQFSSTRNVSSRSLFAGTDSIIRTIGAYKRMIVPVIDGEKLYDISSMEPVNDVEVDDEFTDKLLKSIIMKIGLPPTLMDMMSQDEYVASLTQHRIDYRNLILERGVRYGGFVTKLLRLIVNYSDINLQKEGMIQDGVTVVQQSAEVVDLDKIEFKFAPPRSITINKLKDEIDQISPLVDELIKVRFGDQDPDGNEWPIIKNEVRKELIKYFSSSTDWAEIDDIIDMAKVNGVKTFSEMAKHSVPTTPGDEGDKKPEGVEEDEEANAEKEMDDDMMKGDFGGAPE